MIVNLYARWRAVKDARVSAVCVPLPLPVHTVPLQERSFLPLGVGAPAAGSEAGEKHTGSHDAVTGLTEAITEDDGGEAFSPL